MVYNDEGLTFHDSFFYNLTFIRTPKNRKDTASIGLSLVFLVIKITLKRFVEEFFVRLLVS